MLRVEFECFRSAAKGCISGSRGNDKTVPGSKAVYTGAVTNTKGKVTIMKEEKSGLFDRFKNEDRNKLISILVIIICVSLLINVFLTGWSFYIISAQYPGTRSEVSYKRHVAMSLLEHSRDMADDLGVSDRSSVREALADFSYAIETSGSQDELKEIILSHPGDVEEIIIEEWEAEFEERIKELVNEDPGLEELDELTQVTIELSEDEIKVQPYNFLNASTIARAEDYYAEGDFIGTQLIELEISDGEARFTEADDEQEQIEILTEELNSLRESLRDLRAETGYAEKTGEGIVVRIYDEAEAVDSPSIVHDTDIRDVVNELLASGAEGVAVGGQRLTATSAIRCTGPLIKVNDNLIPVNPVEIEAVGDPRNLESGVDIIKNTLEGERRLSFEVESSDSITLPSYDDDD